MLNCIYVLGQPALSEFKCKQLLEKQLTHEVDDLVDVSAFNVYFIQLNDVISNQELEQLCNLLDGYQFNPTQLFGLNSTLVTPRSGTISAWSSKALDIVKRCGFATVSRIEVGKFFQFRTQKRLGASNKELFHPFLHDRMTEEIFDPHLDLSLVFRLNPNRELQHINCSILGISALKETNRNLGLALSNSEIQYLHKGYKAVGRNPTDAELMMFSQVNSEHCRHKIFNAKWHFGNTVAPDSMFSMIRMTEKQAPVKSLVAYDDNAAVVGHFNNSLNIFPNRLNRQYRFSKEPLEIVFKAETHNHPTAISPFPGAATGSGGEIRDEGATGRGGQPKAGICGFSVSNLRVPNHVQPWEENANKPARIASPLKIMLEGPVGAASFNNEFGRPNISGYFRTFETARNGSMHWLGYHKPLMLAGGLGSIRRSLIKKKSLRDQDLIIVIGGPSLLIGLGGGAASSLDQGSSAEELDFASVQRSNPEIQRRCQEVINRCAELDDKNPIISIHDVGAGGLSNAVPEIVHADGLGALIELNSIPVGDPSLSPMENWCNEAQERYVIAISPDNLDQFSSICKRENCPFAIIGKVTSDPKLLVVNSNSEDDSGKFVVNLDMNFLMSGVKPATLRDKPLAKYGYSIQTPKLVLRECIERVLRFPSVADKTFLVTIGDRTVTGLIHRDQMVGPWQVPVADSAITLAGYDGYIGETFAIGERSPLAKLDAPASARMAVGEALTNIRSAPITSLKFVKICANWMAASKIEGELFALYESVKSVALDLCLRLGISVPVGKDSLSMSTEWTHSNGHQCRVYSPISLIATAFAPLDDVRGALTPLLQSQESSHLLLIDLGLGRNRMGMSALCQTFKYYEGEVPDFESVTHFSEFFELIGRLMEGRELLAYHDRSDGGVFVTLCEMAFCSRVGLDIYIKDGIDPIDFLFTEELGAVIQVKSSRLDSVMKEFEKRNLSQFVHQIASVNNLNEIRIFQNGDLIYKNLRTKLHRMWSELTWQMQSIRDNSDCATEEYNRIEDIDDPGLSIQLDESKLFGRQHSSGIHISKKVAPKMAILREQGVNGHLEMAAAFTNAGFACFDVMMTDLVTGRTNLTDFDGLAICGGFSYGDVMGAGRGWAGTILQNLHLKDMFQAFFENRSKFALGICNGCQVLSELKSIIPGAGNWPKFVRNRSEQFEARLVMVEVSSSNSLITKRLQGSFMPVPVAHGEGRAVFKNDQDSILIEENELVCLRYVNNRLQPTNEYPYNPNGSKGAIAGVTNLDGRITLMMPHPERVFRSLQYSWFPANWGQKESPWSILFGSAKTMF